MISFVSLSMWLAAHAASPSSEQPRTALLVDSAPAWLQAPAPDEPKWTGSLSAGALMTSGNSQTRNANATASAEYKREHDRITLGFLWTYAEEKNTTPNWLLNDRKTLATAKYDYFLSEKTYALAQVSGESDLAADLELRTTIGVGAGRQFRDDATWKLSAEGGVSWIDESYDSTRNGYEDDYVAGRFAGKAEWNLNQRWSLGEDALYLQSLEHAEDVNLRFDTRVKATLTESFFAQLEWIIDWDNTPQSAHRTDHRWLFGVGWKF